MGSREGVGDVVAAGRRSLLFEVSHYVKLHWKVSTNQDKSETERKSQQID